MVVFDWPTLRQRDSFLRVGWIQRFLSVSSQHSWICCRPFAIWRWDIFKERMQRRRIHNTGLLCGLNSFLSHLASNKCVDGSRHFQFQHKIIYHCLHYWETGGHLIDCSFKRFSYYIVVRHDRQHLTSTLSETTLNKWHVLIIIKDFYYLYWWSYRGLCKTRN